VADRLDVGVAPAVLPLLQEWKRRNRERPQCAEAILYRAIKAAVDTVLSSAEKVDAPQHKLRAPLTNVCRLKPGPASRYRLFFIFSLKHRKSIVLWIGFRKEGDRKDAYTQFTKMLQKGTFDEQFRELEIPIPKG